MTLGVTLPYPGTRTKVGSMIQADFWEKNKAKNSVTATATGKFNMTGNGRDSNTSFRAA